MTGGVHLAAREREGESNGSGFWIGGLRARSGAGPDWLPGVQSYFYFPFLFSFSIFFKLSSTFQI
jgi:hypothetical protein